MTYSYAAGPQSAMNLPDAAADTDSARDAQEAIIEYARDLRALNTSTGLPWAAPLRDGMEVKTP